MDITEASRIELSNLLARLSARLGAEESHAELGGEVDRNIQALRESANRILKDGKNDVFVQYLMAQLQALTNTFVEASGTGVLRVREHEFNTAKLLLSAFGDGERLIRFTWKLPQTERLFEDEVWRKQFQLTSALANSGVLEIRAMLITENRTQLDTENVAKLLDFYASQSGMNAKIIESAVWDACTVDHGLSQNFIEFGVYGSNLLYQADTYTPVSVGKWSKDKIEIERYANFFDSVWNMSATTAYKAGLPQKVSLSQLMAIDAEHERRKNAVHETVSKIAERLHSDAA